MLTLAIVRVLICGVRNNGGKPCHRCLVPKDDMAKLGAPIDTERRDLTRCVLQNEEVVTRARADIESGCAIDGAKVESLLKPESLTPSLVRPSSLPPLRAECPSIGLPFSTLTTCYVGL